MTAPEPIDVIVRGGLICGKCGQPISPGEPGVRAMGFYCAHDEERCLALLHRALAKARAENAELREDKARLDWLAEAEFSLRPHREKTPEYFEVWWTVYTCTGRTLSHPYGNLRAAIDAAMHSGEGGEKTK